MLSPFPEAPRKRLCIFKIMMECAENIPLKTDRRGSSAEVPAIAHLTAEAKTQAAEAWRKLWRKRVDRNRQRVLNTAQMAFPFKTPFIQCAPPSFKLVYKPQSLSLEVQDLKKYIRMKIRRKWVKKVRPFKILMMYLLRPYGKKGTLL